MLSRLIYSSTCRCSTEEAHRLCAESRVSNAHNQITGALYLANNTFYQYLEGDAVGLSALYSKIQRDPRHMNCTLLDGRLISMRIFKGWSMTWLVRTIDTDRVMQAVIPRDSNPATPVGAFAGTLFLALAQSAEHR